MEIWSHSCVSIVGRLVNNLLLCKGAMARHFSPSVKRAVVLTFHAVCLGVRGLSLLILVLLLGATMHQRNHPLLSLKSYQTASLSAAELWKKKHPLLWFELGLVALIITMAPHLLGLFGIVHYHLAKFSLILSAKGCLPPWAWLDLWQEVVCRCFVFCCWWDFHWGSVEHYFAFLVFKY